MYVRFHHLSRTSFVFFSFLGGGVLRGGVYNSVYVSTSVLNMSQMHVNTCLVQIN